MEQQDLRETLLSYARSARNGVLHDGYSHAAIRKNPLCGDEVELRLTVADGRIAQCSFKVRGCAICTAATALLSEAVVDKSIDDVGAITQSIERFIAGENDRAAVVVDIPDDMIIFEPLQRNPRRRECALLPWYALKDALKDAPA